MRVVVFGAGAIGSLLGAFLLRAGHDVLLVGRLAHVRAMADHGLRIEGSTSGTFHPVATESLDRSASADRVLVTVKTFDLVESGAALARGLSAPRPVLTVQNGLGIEELLAAGLRRSGWADAPSWIERAINSIPATFVGPGVVRHAGEGEVIFGPDRTGSPTSEFARLLHSAGIPVRSVPDLEREVWRKLLVNAAINPVTADHGIRNGALTRDPWRGQALALLEEAHRVANVEGYDFAFDEVERDLWRIVAATAENESSMLQDIRRGRPTEIDAISGALLARGSRHGLDLPYTRRAVERIARRAASAPKASAS